MFTGLQGAAVLAPLLLLFILSLLSNFFIHGKSFSISCACTL